MIFRTNGTGLPNLSSEFGFKEDSFVQKDRL